MKKFATILLSLIIAVVFVAGCGSITNGVDDPSAASVKGKVYETIDLTVSYSDGYPDEYKLSEEDVEAMKQEAVGGQIAFGTDYKYYEIDDDGSLNEAGTFSQIGKQITLVSSYYTYTAALTGNTLVLDMIQASGTGSLTVTLTLEYNGTFGGAGGEDDEEGGNEFTVCLIDESGSLFIPEETITVNWTDGHSYYSADIGRDGYARVEGLDGDYQVTLSNPPASYIYDCNSYYATNDNKDVQIEIFKYNTTTLTGSDLYSTVITFSTEGVYRVTLTRASSPVYYCFRPKQTGVYSVESWVDITSNEINPKLDLFIGTTAAWYQTDTIDGGGESSSYTKNFRYEFEATSTHYAYAYGIWAETRVQTTTFPCYIYFKLTREGDLSSSGSTERDPAVPEEKFDRLFTDDYTGVWQNAVDNGLFDGTRCAFNEDDGYYWRIDPVTGEFLYRLYAKIAQPCVLLDAPLISLDEDVQGVMSSFNIVLSDGTICSYKSFLQTYAEHCDAIDVNDSRFEYDINEECYYLVDPDTGMRLRKMDSGTYPVTQELKDFLQAFAIQQAYFMDGLGYAEGAGYNSAEEDQWLFACGYYIP